ncbi:hypothetical protein O0I10_004727 [Lichtheimia ornata]|uniref:Uncharacterized protein n=1 Tax=Lichtheimia ornata TaxID=688661 RepID=A0AAD7V5F9_9FUNG|nr:uncharacterized protein O0I10_004727 [Lichtheimia ornata]KAJ8659367.1 hypothetical protein O0I10_004727 [Lichtheimia ornata]
MKNSPRSIFLGWAGLAVCALGGYLGSKAYTSNRLKEYTTQGFNSSPEQAHYQSEQQQQQQQAEESGDKPLRRSVQRTL